MSHEEGTLCECADVIFLRVLPNSVKTLYVGVMKSIFVLLSFVVVYAVAVDVITVTNSWPGFVQPQGGAVSADGKTLVWSSGDYRIFKVNLTTGTMTDLAGSGISGWQNGVAAAARFTGPRGVAFSPDQLTIYSTLHPISLPARLEEPCQCFVYRSKLWSPCLKRN